MQHLRVDNKTHCPCRQCLNVRFHDLVTIEQHLIRYGFSSSYNKWIHHGENIGGVSRAQISMLSDRDGCAVNENYVEDDNYFDDDIIVVLNDTHAPINKEADSNEYTSHEIGRNGKNIDNLFGEAHKALYPGCNKFSELTFLVKLMHIKMLNRWSNKSFDMLLKLLLDAFPNGTSIPKSHYDVKKMLHDYGLGYDSIHACKYDCALFWKENGKLHNCPVCSEPRYKKGKIPQKVLQHFPLMPRLQRLFLSRHTSVDM